MAGSSPAMTLKKISSGADLIRASFQVCKIPLDYIPTLGHIFLHPVPWRRRCPDVARECGTGSAPAPLRARCSRRSRGGRWLRLYAQPMCLKTPAERSWLSQTC